MSLMTKISARSLGIAALSALIGAGIGSAATAYQGHMWNALSDLQSARGELEAAASNKGGHRVNAINLIDQAIGEVRAGIAAGAM